MPSDLPTPWQRCRVVSLPTDTERRQHIDAQLQRAGVSYEFADGVPGSSLDPQDLRDRGLATAALVRNTAVPSWVTLNKIGCALAHLSVMEEVFTGGGTTPTLVFEDDAGLADDFVERASALIARVPDAEMLFLGHTAAEASETPSESGVELARVPRGGYGYLVWPNAAATILEGALPIGLPIDEYIVNIIARGEIRAYVANPQLVRPNRSLLSRIHHGSEAAS